MTIEQLVKNWFQLWEEGRFEHLPLTKNFTHTSPFGIIQGKEQYLDLVKENQDKFLGHHFEILDSIYEEDRACVRYVAKQDDFQLEVSEWHYMKEGLIDKVVAYYHVGDIREDRQLKQHEG